MKPRTDPGRLSTFAAALVVARRDFVAILFSRSFLFFLLGPLFPIVVAGFAGGVGQRVQASADSPRLGVAMRVADVERIAEARATLSDVAGVRLPELRVVARLAPDEPYDPKARFAEAGVSAILSGTPEHPRLTGPQRWLDAWRGPVSLIAAQAQGSGPSAYPPVAMTRLATDQGANRSARLKTAQGAQTLLFLLTMLLAGMVLSNLVEEKGNKIIEILAAAIPMDAVFFGKLFAMLGVSFVGIAVWGSVVGAIVASAGSALPSLPAPAVGWPMLFVLGVIYFAMAYLLLGSLFLAIGSMASTVREVQTLSMPVTMLQLINFFLASFAMTQPGSAIEWIAILIPFSSPFAMLARAAQDPALLPHLLALGWQVLCVVIFVRMGARLFRKRVMKSGPAPVKKRRRLFGGSSAARA
ncbi:ABC transporter permease [Novosphingobium sp. PC22D]|uniref:ABC transporter permease n=1 Tax=Novosphingobium sp. PC22D TaxID=1962403 RepID=UPI000BF1CEAE|nr:ABC transporter permease [Novosphingobium sp. PC22D]PEQ12294.1 ABC transporter permease [Novosphingobium sp. PC22D]